jgi:hypothetical protein
MAARLRAGRRILSQLLDADDQRLPRLVELTLEAALPANVESLSGGVLWIGIDLQGPGMALYSNPVWGAADAQWSRARRWLREILPDVEAAERLVSTLRPIAHAASLAVEGTDERTARAKLYWRPAGPWTTCRLALPLLQDDALREFVALVHDDGQPPATGIVMSAGFAVATGELVDVKVDLCAHCAPRTTAAWLSLIGSCQARWRLAAVDLVEPDLPGCEVALVGLGLDGRGRLRLNVYFKAETM